VEAAVASRVELRQATAAIEREALQRQLARTAIWTGTELSAATGLVAGQPAFSTSVTFPLPLYRQQGEIAEAEANRARAEAKRQALAQAIALEVHQAFNQAENAAKQVAIFTRTYVPQAQRLLENAQVRFKAGEGSALEVAEARRAVRETKVELFRAVLEHEQALIRLERALGHDLAPQAR
jgi:outer membrane protein TolC